MKTAIKKYPKVIKFTKKTLAQTRDGSGFEWIVTNGIGGFASGTATGLNTRRYHGLLVAALNPPVQRTVMVTSVDETVNINSKSYELATHQYPGVIHPAGNQHIKSFEFGFYPVFRYKVGDFELSKTIWMEWGKNTTFVNYKVTGGTRDNGSLSLQIRPMLNLRDYHSLQKASNGNRNIFSIKQNGNSLEIDPYLDQPGYRFIWSLGDFTEDRMWFYNLEYLQEQSRGLDFLEDVYSIGYIKKELAGGQSLTLAFSAEDKVPVDVLIDDGAESIKRFCKRKTILMDNASHIIDSNEHRRLVLSADDFIVDRRSTGSKTIIAGYPWFSDWGRDTMISLPGLTLATGRVDDAKSILQTFAGYIDNGLVPNLFPDSGHSPEYNTVDGTLWFVIALFKYYKSTGDKSFIVEVFPKLKEIITKHVEGTLFGIRADKDGLLIAGEPGVQLTWMDAKVGDWVVTPRHGKPVEVNALWINAIYIYREFSKLFGRETALTIEPEKLREVFNDVFWNEELSCLFDVVSGDKKDSSIRPNQIFAISLPFPLLDKKRAELVLQSVEKHLLTDFGLRTLNRDSQNYRPHYGGNVWERDSAYHQGTVWPWLIGPYLTACLDVRRDTEKNIQSVKQKLEFLLSQTEAGGLGNISEVYDAEQPYNAGGCFAQAWSVATTLEVIEKLKIQTKKI